MLKQLATTVALAATAFFSPVSAEEIVTVRGGLSLDREHTALVQAINAAGVNVQVNVGSNCNSGSDGVYYPGRAVLAVCQDKAPQPHWSEVRWTANDLDTLRHEAVHLLQDCNAQDGVGGYTRLWFETEQERIDFVQSALSQDKINWIIDTYAEAGADTFDIKAELEAFSIAATVSPGVLANAITTTCSAY
tara:strand:- start:1507 stop:2079 length:573 start_codon:yes stop_codon:yes gene_type:complete